MKKEKDGNAADEPDEVNSDGTKKKKKAENQEEKPSAS